MVSMICDIDPKYKDNITYGKNGRKFIYTNSETNECNSILRSSGYTGMLGWNCPGFDSDKCHAPSVN
jgi:hypothetical protein